MRLATVLTNSWSCELISTLSLKLDQRVAERLDGFEVEVVGRRVQHERIGLLDHHLRHHAAHLRRREDADLLVNLSPLKSILPRYPSNRVPRCRTRTAPEEVDDRELARTRGRC